MKKIIDKNYGNSLILFLIWPFAAVILSFKNHSEKYTKNILWLFVIFYGYAYIANTNQDNDSERYIIQLDDMYFNSNVGDGSFVNSLYSSEETIDILQPVLTYFISRFTNNPKILFAAFGLIFGFFMSRNLWFIFAEVKNKIPVFALPFIFLFFFIVPMWQINSFRFWTATHIFLYGVFLFLLKEKKIQGVLFLLITPFVHWSYSIAILIFVAYKLFGNNIKILFYLFVISFFMAQIKLEFVGNFIESFLPSLVADRSRVYLNDDYINLISDELVVTNWYIQFRSLFLRYLITALIIYIFTKYKKEIVNNKNTSSLFALGLIFFIFSNLTDSIPSVGRFYTLTNMLFMAFFVSFIINNVKATFSPSLKYATYLISLMYILVEVRIGFDSIGLSVLFGNPISMFFVESEKAIITLIK